MAWNEPGNGQKDPWNRQRASGRKTDIDGLLKNLKSRFGRLGNSGGIVTVVLAILLAWLLLSSYVIVGAREVGVVLRFGEFSRMLPPGFHLKLPRPFETVTRVQTTQVQSVSVNARMLTSYRKQGWDEALDLIDQCRRAANGFDITGLYDMYAERIEAYRADPPPPDWNGVYEAESK